MTDSATPTLTRFAWLSIGAAIVTIGLKLIAWKLTGSVGLLSDAMESVVNLVAAIIALIALNVAGREPDEDHAYGHAKVEYFSSGIEGMMIFVAAVAIIWTAVPQIIDPQPLEQTALGLIVNAGAAAINGAVAWRLFRAAAAYRSITLRADAHHLMTDIWTSLGVLVGVALVPVTGWHRLDGVLAVAVAANILFTGYRLMRDSINGLMDPALPPEEQEQIDRILNRYARDYGISWHALRTREAGQQRFIRFHVLVPGEWTVLKGHDILEQMEREIEAAIPHSSATTHLEPIEDPLSFKDLAIKREPIDPADA